MFVKSEPSPLNICYPEINSVFRIACVRSWRFLSNHVACNRWFPYNPPDRPDRPSPLKKCSDDRDDHMETLPRRSQTTRAIQNLHDRPDRPDRTQFYPSDRGRLSRPGRLRSSG